MSQVHLSSQCARILAKMALISQCLNGKLKMQLLLNLDTDVFIADTSQKQP